MRMNGTRLHSLYEYEVSLVRIVVFCITLFNSVLSMAFLCSNGEKNPNSTTIPNHFEDRPTLN